MSNLYTYGPLAVALEPGMDFMYYRSGVYRHTSEAMGKPWA